MLDIFVNFSFYGLKAPGTPGLRPLGPIFDFVCKPYFKPFLKHVQNICFCIELLIELLIELPIGLPIVLTGLNRFCVWQNPPNSQTLRLSLKSDRKPFSGGLKRHKE